MTFRKTDQTTNVSSALATLNSSKTFKSNNPLYQSIRTLIDSVISLENIVKELITNESTILEKGLTKLEIFKKTVLIRHPQILTLPTAPVDILPAFGEGYIIKLVGASSIANIVAPYGNINLTYAALTLSYESLAGWWAAQPGAVNDSGAVPPLTLLGDILGNIVKRRIDWIVPTMLSNTGWILPFNFDVDTYYNNKKLVLAVDNNGSSDFDAGHVDNWIKTTVYFTIDPIDL